MMTGFELPVMKSIFAACIQWVARMTAPVSACRYVLRGSCRDSQFVASKVGSLNCRALGINFCKTPCCV